MNLQQGGRGGGRAGMVAIFYTRYNLQWRFQQLNFLLTFAAIIAIPIKSEFVGTVE